MKNTCYKESNEIVQHTFSSEFRISILGINKQNNIQRINSQTDMADAQRQKTNCRTLANLQNYSK